MNFNTHPFCFCPCSLSFVSVQSTAVSLRIKNNHSKIKKIKLIADVLPRTVRGWVGGWAGGSGGIDINSTLFNHFVHNDFFFL